MFRKVFTGAARQGKKILDGILQKGENVGKHVIKPQNIQTPTSTGGLFRHFKDGFARVSITQNLARYAKKNLASELRRQFNKSPSINREYRGLAGKLSLYAFVGIGYAAHNGVEERNYDGILESIRDIVRIKQEHGDYPEEYYSIKNHDLGNYHLGSMIAKGCNAAVYQAKYKYEESLTESMECYEEDEGLSSGESSVSDCESDVEVIDNDLPPAYFTTPDATETQVSDFFFLDTEDLSSEVEVISEDGEATDICFLISCDRNMSTTDDVGITSHPSRGSRNNKQLKSVKECDLAMKMMFNYDVESNALAVFRSMKKELVPAQIDFGLELLGDWHNGHRSKEKSHLPPHPNIVCMYGGFVDEMPMLPDAFDAYPDALPYRINKDGFGRNKTLFLVMKRYPWTLREYLSTHSLSVRQSLLLLTQLVEAVLHMVNHNVAHRDLKSDNIFVEEIDECPHLVVSDFGDCLLTDDLHLPYNTDEISKGGNAALQAPEIALACPGPDSYLDYKKSDLWTAGTLAYEIFGNTNPFYNSATGKRLNSASYREKDLPRLGAHVPKVMLDLIADMLIKDPTKRPCPEQIAVRLHLLLWSPSEWLRSRPSEVSVTRWLLTSTARILLKNAQLSCSSEASPKSCMVEHELLEGFLSRIDFTELMEGVLINTLCN